MSEESVLTYQAAGGVVVDEAGRVLLIERNVDGRHEVRLPKGHIEPGESARRAALREVCEETGYCRLRILAELGRRRVSFGHPDGRRVIRDEQYFLMRLENAQRQAPQFASERESLFRNRWAEGFDEAVRLLTFEAEQDAVAQAGIAFAGLTSGSGPGPA